MKNGSKKCSVYIFVQCIFLFVFLHFKTSPYLIELFRRMLQHRFAVKLQKCFVD